MRTILAAAVVTGALVATSPGAIAGSPAEPAARASKSSQARTSHATTGTVKSIDDTKLVIARGRKGDMTFTVSPSTHREGTVAVGSKVSVRYEQNGKTRMATAISAGASKQEAAAHAAAHAAPVANEKK